MAPRNRTVAAAVTGPRGTPLAKDQLPTGRAATGNPAGPCLATSASG